MVPLLFLLGSGCTPKAGGGTDAGARTYQGSAIVGDFVTLTVDEALHHLTWANATNGLSGTTTYTVASNGSYVIDDPTGNLTMAYELPGFGLAVGSQKSGPKADTLSLLIAVASEPTHLSTFAGNRFNYLQLKTNMGGLEVGAATLDTAGVFRFEFYLPYSDACQCDARFHPMDSVDGGLPSSAFADHGTFLSWVMNDPNKPEDVGSTLTLMGTRGGLLVLDTPNGSGLLLQETATKDFDPSNAGTYNTILYRKQNAQDVVIDGGIQPELGQPSLGLASVVVDASAHLTLTELATGATIASGTLTPVADAASLVGPGALADGEHGLFTFHAQIGGQQADVFVAFLDRGVVLGAFAGHPHAAGQPLIFDYFHGFGLKQP